MDRGKLKLVKSESDTAGRTQRPHKPAELGSRVFKSKTGSYAIDLRWRGKGRPILRNPDDLGWPDAGTTTTKKSEAERWGKIYDARWVAEQQEEEQRRTGRYRTMGLAREAFLAHREAQNAPSTLSGSRMATSYLVDIVGAEKDPASVTKHEVQNLCNRFLTNGYKASSVNNIKNHLVAFFDYLNINPNPARDVAIPKSNERDIVPWDDSQRAKIRAAADEIDAASPGGPSRRLLVEHLFSQGTRIQETAAAMWEDIDATSKTARIWRQVDRRTGEFRITKNNNPRTTTVMPEWWKFHQKDAKGFILSTSEGKPIPYRTLYTYVRDVLERAKLKKPGEAAHQFRHTYAFVFLERGGNISSLQKCLGHKRESTTINFYDHFTSEHAARAGVMQIYGGLKSGRRKPRPR